MKPVHACDHTTILAQGGGVFQSLLNRTKYIISRSEGQRLLLESTQYGILLLITSYLFIALISAYIPEARLWWRGFVRYPGLGVPALSLILGLVLPSLLNKISKKSSNRYNLESYGCHTDFFGKILFQAQLDKQPVLFCLRSGQVYIGYVSELNSPGKHDGASSIKIQPLMSGFRSKHLGYKLVLTTDYASVHKQIRAESDMMIAELKEKNKVLLGNAEKTGNGYGLTTLPKEIWKLIIAFKLFQKDINNI